MAGLFDCCPIKHYHLFYVDVVVVGEIASSSRLPIVVYMSSPNLVFSHALLWIKYRFR